ncbi:tRNA (adenosine(37)-N6)-threonylcarbamoyltransferase complex ATPase subunit type 1 TsaE [Mailhella massiliensis]|uniref:tRNA threonylcarbamoyladenosine biosynthesis protein TsaE n=1 Tax=Mailhella massiliensis TaxID=1903261 RepID=A0A921AW45_9BACT|nr:tRNA (adenosine(37)-N6)-threonylcarbamoyltransferase complex ATPase subunit type 1 TsaE [Mailhella massiliensis]HJD97208.1 tRNA (adenosine(37)-N6)-threonylcarbamoyltransferase complex ATPase subunit type 1 TsaE [Mailhella massiliensis]
MRLILTSPEDTMELGSMLAKAMIASSVRNLYLFADLGGGKTTLARGFVSALPGGEQAETASPSFTLCNVYPTHPETLHADLYRLSEGASLPEEMEEMLEDGDPFLLLEWPQYLAPERRAAERLDVSLFPVDGERAKQLDNADKSCKASRLASIEARGEKADALLRSLSPELQMRFLPADEA